MPTDYYEILEVDPKASEEVIRKAYRVLAARYHPDVAAGPKAAARMRRLNEAYATLLDPGRRAEYDRVRAQNLVLLFYAEGLVGLAKHFWRREGLRVGP